MSQTPLSKTSETNAASESALADMASEGAGTSAKLAVLSLASIREKIGDEEFVRVHKRIHIAIQSVIGKLLGSGDQIIPAGDDTYVILVRSTGYEEAEQLIAHGCRSLADLFFGQDQFGNLAFKANGNEVVPIGSVVVPRTFEIIASTKKEQAEVPMPAAPAAKPEPKPAPAAPSPLRQWQSMQRTHTDPDKIALNYIPVWDAGNQVLSTYSAGCWSLSPDGQIQDGLLPLANGDELRLAALDAFIIREATKTVCDLLQKEKALLVVVPVHIDALSTPRGKETVIGAMRDIPTDARKFFSVQILHTPKDMAPGILSQRIGEFSALCRATILVIDTWTPKTAELSANPSIKAVSLTLPSAGASRQQMMDVLPAFSRAVLKMKKLPAVIHLRSKAEAQKAVEAGVRHLTGLAIGHPRSEPGNIVRCGLQDLPRQDSPPLPQGDAKAS